MNDCSEAAAAAAVIYLYDVYLSRKNYRLNTTDFIQLEVEVEVEIDGDGEEKEEVGTDHQDLMLTLFYSIQFNQTLSSSLFQ